MESADTHNMLFSFHCTVSVVCFPTNQLMGIKLYMYIEVSVDTSELVAAIFHVHLGSATTQHNALHPQLVIR